jgi:hypothetical protein
MTNWRIGHVLSTEEETYTVKITFLHLDGPSLLYMHPTRPDNLKFLGKLFW